MADYAMDVTASLSGKMKNLHRISVLPGDFVDIELNPYDIKVGRIIYRHNPKNMRG
ncbi:MAG: translation initiation factor IF-1 [bacterium]